MAWLQNAGKKLDSWLFGKGTQALVPPDMRGLRAQNIDLLSSLLSPGAFNPGGAGRNFFFQGGAQGASQFFDAPSPEMKTMETLMPMLEGMMTGTGPQFERDIAMANTSGGRFSSGNVIMRGEALRNLFNQRGQTAQTMGMLAGQAGQAQLARSQMFAQLMAGLLGMSTNATNFPIEGGEQNGIMDWLQLGLSGAGLFAGDGSTWKPPVVDNKGGTWGIPSTLRP
jgi:hypothetical protein